MRCFPKVSRTARDRAVESTRLHQPRPTFHFKLHLRILSQETQRLLFTSVKSLDRVSVLHEFQLFPSLRYFPLDTFRRACLPSKAMNVLQQTTCNNDEMKSWR